MKKLLVSLLSAAMAISSISGSIVTAKADDEIDTSKLRVSDEFVEKYPNGLIEFVNVGSEVNEDAGETTIYVVRRGGTKGTVSVNLKAIEVTAKYGEDFAVMDEGLFGPKEVKKSSNTPSLLEGAINDAKDTAITADGYEEEKEETKTEETQDVSKNSEEQKEEETTSNDETNKEEKEVENIQVEKKYESSLHALKDKTLSKETEYIPSKVNNQNVLDIQNKKNIEVNEALNTVLPGAKTTLTFGEGEAYKKVKVKIKDDKLFEDDETFSLGLYEVSGATLGDQIDSQFIIHDNDVSTENTSYSFKESHLTVSSHQDKVRLTLEKTGNLDSLSTYTIKTRSNTAISETHYASIVKEGAFLAGQNLQYIDVPILNENIENSVSFDVYIYDEDKEMVKATVEILPREKSESKEKASNEPSITISPKNFNGVKNGSNIGTWNNDLHYYIHLRSGWYRSGGYSVGLDLRAAKKVEVDFEVARCQSSYKSRHRTTINIGGKEVWKGEHNQNRSTKTFKVDNSIRKNTNLEMKSESWVWNDATIDTYSIKVYPSQISIETMNSEPQEVFVFDGKDKSVYNNKSYIPGKLTYVNLNSSRTNQFYAGDKIRIKPAFAEEIANFGFYLSGLEIQNSKGSYDLLTNKISENGAYYDLELTADMLSKYASFNNNGDGTIKIRPKFSRKTSTTDIKIQEFDTNQGYVQIGDKEFKGNETYDAKDKLNFGDFVEVNVGAYQHYRVKGLMVNDELIKNTYKNGGFLVPLTSNTVNIKPIFEKTDCSVEIKEIGNVEMYIIHDKVEHMSKNEKKYLYENTEGLTNVDADGNVTNELTNKIKSNYDTYINEIKSNRVLTNLAIGDIVTLSAEPKNDEYIARWQIKGNNETVSNEDFHAKMPHYGNSFSFEVKSKNIVIECSMVKKSDKGLVDSEGKELPYVLNGQVVTLNKNLKSTNTFDKVNLNDPSTYRVLPNVQLSTMTFDLNKSSYNDGNTTYESAVTSDNQGKFSMYIPNLPKPSEGNYGENLFSFKYYYGGIEKAISAANIENDFVFVIPYRDQDYLISSINLYKNNNLDENNGKIVIPENVNEGARVFKVTTKTTNGHKISKVKLNVYNSANVLLSTSELKREKNGENEQIWKLDCNLKELLATDCKITVEAFDEYTRSRGEVPTGYEVLDTPAKLQLTTPAIGKEFEDQGPSNVPVTGSKVPNADKQTIKPDESKNTNKNQDDATEIAVGAGETIKNAISDNIEVFESKTGREKLIFLSNYVTETFSKNVSNSEKSLFNNTVTGNFPISFDFGLYLKFTKSKTDGVTRRSLDNAFVTVALQAGAELSTEFEIFGFPIYAKLESSGYGRGIAAFSGYGDELNEDCIIDNKLSFILNNYSENNKVVTKETEPDENIQKLLKTISELGKPNTSLLPTEGKALADYPTDETKGVLSLEYYKKNATLLRKFKSETTRVLTVAANDDLLYYKHQEVFDSFNDNFNTALQEKIKKYMTNISATTNEVSLDKTWIKKFNLDLLVACMPNYLSLPRTYLQYGNNGVEHLDLNLIGGNSTAGIFTFQPKISIGVGAGKRGMLAMGLSGHTDFIVNYQLWKEGRGTVTFALNLDIEVLIIPLSLRIASTTIEMFRSKGYEESAFDYEPLGPGGMLKNAKSTVSVKEPPRLQSQPTFVHRNLEKTKSTDNDTIVTEDYESTIQTTKHPEPKMFILENGNKLLLFFNDNLSRGSYDKNSIYYSISSKKPGTDMDIWSEPVELEADGTLDGEMEAIKLPNGKIAVAWTNASKQFGNTQPDMADYLTSQNISYVEFDQNGNPSPIQDVTSNEKYAYSLPTLTYEPNSNQVMLTYKMIDYNTQGVEFDYGNVEGTLNSFLNNSFTTLAYSILKDGQWQSSQKENLTNEHFIDVDIPDLENPNIAELASGSYHGNTFISYIVDTDKNTGTLDDREMFIVIYNHENNTFTKPIRCTKDMVENMNVHVVVNEHINSLYYGSDNKIVGLPLDTFFNEDYTIDYSSLNSIKDGAYYELKYEDPETYHVDDNIIDYESRDASSSFDLTLGENGDLYMFWNELSTNNKEEVDNDDKELAHRQRNIYMQVYDPKLQKIESSENKTSYSGGWGSTSRITEDLDTYQNEISLVVSKDNGFTLAWRQFDIKDEVESETSTMYITEFEMVSSVMIDETSITGHEEYSKAGEEVSVGFDVKNYGFIPTKSVKFDYYLATDKDMIGQIYDKNTNTVYEDVEMLNNKYFNAWDHPINGKSVVALDSTKVEDYFNSKAKIHQDVKFNMPEYNEKVSLYIVAWEQNDTDNDVQEPSILEIPIKIEPHFTVLNQQSSLSSQKDSIRLTGTLINDGNSNAKETTFEFINKELMNLEDLEINPENQDSILLETTALNVGDECHFDILITDEEQKARATISKKKDHTKSNSEPELEEVKTRATIKKKKVRSMLNADGNVDFQLSAIQENDTRATIKKKKEIKSFTVTNTSETPKTLTDLYIPITKKEIVNNKARNNEPDLIKETLQLDVNQTKNLNPTLAPYGADKNYRLEYVSEDPSIVTISPDGYITSHQEGTTNIKIKVRQLDKVNTLISHSNGNITDAYGNNLPVDDNGNIMVNQNKNETPITYEKTIEVAVKQGTGGEQLPEDIPPTTDRPSIDDSTIGSGAKTFDQTYIWLCVFTITSSYVVYRYIKKRKNNIVN